MPVVGEQTDTATVTLTTTWDNWTRTCATTGSQDAWIYWTTGSPRTTGERLVVTTTTSNYVRDPVWRNWTTSPSSVTLVDPFHIWVREDTTIETVVNVGRAHAQNDEEHRAFVERMERIRAEQEQARIRRERAVRAASSRARDLLVAYLDRTQLRQLEAYGFFFVRGKSGRRYRIREGRVANVDLMHRFFSNRVEHSLCAHPHECVPNFDTMLAQKLMIETDEARFLAIANVHPNRARIVPPRHAVAA